MAVLLGLGATCWLLYGHVFGYREPVWPDARQDSPATDVVHKTSADPSVDRGPSEKEKPKAASERSPSPSGRETFDYTGNVSSLSNVAALRVVVAGGVEFMGRGALHLQAFAKTQNPLRMIFALDDQFDSYLDPKSLTSLQFELHLNERGQRVDSVLRMTSDNEPAPADAIAARVLPGTRDPLAMLHYLRAVNWARTPEVRCPVFDGHKLYEARAKLLAPAEIVEVPAGKYSVAKIDLRVFQDGVENKDSRFVLYLANDPAHTPVALDAILPFANARVELVRAH